MPFGLGFFATAGVSAAGGSYELITSTILTSSQSSVTFSNLVDYSSTYQHLQIRYAARTSLGGAIESVLLRMNGVSSGSYRSHNLYGNGSAVYSDATTPNGMLAGLIFGSSATANAFNAAVIDILDPYESKNKTIRTFSGVSSSLVALTSGLFMSTDSLSSITLIPENATNFVQYSRFSLYGLKASA